MINYYCYILKNMWDQLKSFIIIKHWMVYDLPALLGSLIVHFDSDSLAWHPATRGACPAAASVLSLQVVLAFETHLPSGKHTKNYGKSPFFMGKSTISLAIFNS